VATANKRGKHFLLLHFLFDKKENEEEILEFM
jgi:hypothetical protein